MNDQDYHTEAISIASNDLGIDMDSRSSSNIPDNNTSLSTFQSIKDDFGSGLKRPHAASSDGSSPEAHNRSGDMDLTGSCDYMGAKDSDHLKSATKMPDGSYDVKHKTPTLGQFAEQIQARARSIAFGPSTSGTSGGSLRSYDDTSESQKSDDADDDEGGGGVAICEAGQEQTGRWTREEHDLFLKALKKYGKEWKKIASMVRTRTVIQTRTHAQKFFQKLTKSSISSQVNIDTFDLSSWNGLDYPDMDPGIGSSSKKPRRIDSTSSTGSSSKDKNHAAQGKVALHTPNLKGAVEAGMQDALLPHGQQGDNFGNMWSGGSGNGGRSQRRPMNLKIIDPDRMPSVTLFAEDMPQTPWESDIKHMKRSDQFGLPSSTLTNKDNLAKSLATNIYSLLTSGNNSVLDNYLRELTYNDSKDASRSVDSVANILNTYHTNGNTLLMEVCLLDNVTEAAKLSLCATLVDNGAIPSLTDLKGNSCLHICAEKGLENIAKFLLNKGASANSRNENGDTPLHLAVSHGNPGIISNLIACGANCHVRNNNYKGVLEVVNDSVALTTPAERNALRKFLLIQEPRLRTLIAYHDDFLQHSSNSINSWENPDRLIGIMEGVKALDGDEVFVTSNFNKATVEVLSNIHSLEYLNFVDSLSKRLGESANLSNDSEFSQVNIPFTPQVQKFLYQRSDEELKKPENSDTAFSAQTLRASRRAVGAVVHAVDVVLNGAARNAFCAVRPPSHHAGYQGLLAEAKSCGFCIFNSVAAGAVHALKTHKCERVAIVDLDIHHGNGTEDIVRRYPNHSRLFFFSLHLFDSDDDNNHQGFQFFPGSGVKDDLLCNIINVPIMPLWLDTNRNTPSAEISPVSSLPLSSLPTASSSSTSNSSSTSRTGGPERKQVSGRLAYRQVVQQRLIPALRAFNPSLIIISMGFDAALGDIGNKKQTSNGNFETGMDLLPEDFEWATSELCKVAEVCCDGKLVSVLEGGYGSYETKPVASTNTGAKKAGSELSEETATTLISRSLLTTSTLAHIKRLINPFE